MARVYFIFDKPLRRTKKVGLLSNKGSTAMMYESMEVKELHEALA